MDPLYSLSRQLDMNTIELVDALAKYHQGEMSDKTFSKIYCSKFELEPSRGIIIQVKNNIINEKYWIGSISPNFKEKEYIIHYDFRHKYENLDTWLAERPYRPKPIIVERLENMEKINIALNLGKLYNKNFYLIIQETPKDLIYVRSCMDSKENIYIECYLGRASHGRKNSILHIISKKKIYGDNLIFQKNLLKKIVKGTYDFTDLMGEGTFIEWGIVENKVFLFTAQRSITNNLLDFSDLLIDSFNDEQIKIISLGKSYGKIKKIDIDNLDILTKLLSIKNKKYIFFTELPNSKLYKILPYANGFIFKKGSILCHLSILLREKKIPALIIGNYEHRVKENSYAYIDNNLLFIKS